MPTAAVDDYGIDGYVVGLFSRTASHAPTASQRLHDQRRCACQRLGARHTGCLSLCRILRGRALSPMARCVSDETEPRAQLEAASAAIRDQEQDLVDAMMWGTGGTAWASSMACMWSVLRRVSIAPGWCRFDRGPRQPRRRRHQRRGRTHPCSSRTTTRRACSNRSASRTAFVRLLGHNTRAEVEQLLATVNRLAVPPVARRGNRTCPAAAAGRHPRTVGWRLSAAVGHRSAASSSMRSRCSSTSVWLTPPIAAELLIAAGGRGATMASSLPDRWSRHRAPSTVELPCFVDDHGVSIGGRVCIGTRLPCRCSMPPHLTRFGAR